MTRDGCNGCVRGLPPTTTCRDCARGFCKTCVEQQRDHTKLQGFFLCRVCQHVYNFKNGHRTIVVEDHTVSPAKIESIIVNPTD